MKRFISYFVVFVLGFLVCAYTLQSLYGPGGGSGNVTVARETPRPAPDVVGQSSNRVKSAAAMVSDYVVNIDTIGKPVVRNVPPSFFDMPFGFRPETVVPKGQGSGVIFSSDGYIVTNNHVAAGAAEMKVTLRSGKEYSARLIGRDATTDIAVIKIDARRLPFAKFANSDNLQVGDWVIAVGSPLGYESTVTVGVVSALRRGPWNIGGRSLQLEKLIQTDAAINPGNSGGALSDLNGNLVGVNSMIASTSGGNIGIGFSIPSNTAKVVAEQLIKTGNVAHPYLGVSYGPYDADRRQQREQDGVTGLPKEEGAEIDKVFSNTPADQAGLNKGDIILKINGKPVSVSARPESGKTTISEVVGRSKIGSTITLQIWRASDARIVDVKVRLGKMPDGFGEPQQ